MLHEYGQLLLNINDFPQRMIPVIPMAFASPVVLLFVKQKAIFHNK